MKTEQFNPYVRFFNKVIGTPIYTKMICAFDFRLFYIVKGEVLFEFQSEVHKLTAGDLITIRPGLPYKLNFEKSKDVEYFLVNFDFEYEQHTQKERTPVGDKNFDKNEIFSNAYLPPFENIFVMRHCDSFEPFFQEMECFDVICDQEQAILRSALLKTILAKIIIKHKSNNSETVDLIQDIKRYIQQNSGTALTNTMVAKYFGYHPYYLNSMFLAEQNITLHKYIENARLKKAKEKLNLTEKPISAIALELGFKDSSYFSAFFKRVSGMTPKEYRQLCR